MSHSWTQEQRETIREIVQRRGGAREATLSLLSFARQEFGSLDRATLELLSESVPHSLAELTELATFYYPAQETPRESVHVEVCMGLPCALRGAEKLARFCSRQLQLRSLQSPDDGDEQEAPLPWSWSAAKCFSLCDQGAVVKINHQPYCSQTTTSLERLVKERS